MRPRPGGCRRFRRPTGPAWWRSTTSAGWTAALLHLVIADRTSDAYLGETMLALSEHPVGEVGCWVVPAARGRGVATEALVALTDWSFSALGLGRVQVFVAPENEAALRLAQSAGFQREGVLRVVLGDRRGARRCRNPRPGSR